MFEAHSMNKKKKRTLFDILLPKLGEKKPPLFRIHPLINFG